MEHTQELEWAPTAEVRPGDRLALLLSDAEAYPEVTGWHDRELDLTRHDLGRPVHRVFAVRPVQWWFGPGHEDMRTADLAGETLIVRRGTYRPGGPAVLNPGRCGGCGQ